MAMGITSNYGSYAVQGMSRNRTVNSSKRDSYMNQLAKLAPSVECRIGTGFASAKTGKTLTINLKLLEKMQYDPEKEKEMKELIKGVESMTRLSESLNKASGWKTVFRHSYIDENGNYRHVALIRNEYGYKMSEKLRKERWENSDKFIKKMKEKATKKKEELQDKLGDKKVKAHSKVEQIYKNKIADSEDGLVYMDHHDLKSIMEAMKEEHVDKTDKKGQMGVGENIDLQI